jgi:hypothetical protein
MPRHVNVVLRKSELLDSFSVNHGASPYTDVTEQFASNENALEFSADDFINLHSNGVVGDQHSSNKRNRSSLDATDAINELFADVLQSKRLKSNDGLKPEYGAGRHFLLSVDATCLVANVIPLQMLLID